MFIHNDYKEAIINHSLQRRFVYDEFHRTVSHTSKLHAILLFMVYLLKHCNIAAKSRNVQFTKVIKNITILKKKHEISKDIKYILMYFNPGAVSANT